MKWTRDNFVLYDERNKANADVVHSMLVDTYWAKGRSLQTVRDTIERCLCFSLYDEHSQIGFARVLTDYATYAIILDVVIQEPYRGRGLGKWMMECMTDHPDVAPLKQVLWTSNAEELYQRFGFSVPAKIHFMLKTVQNQEDGT